MNASTTSSYLADNFTVELAGADKTSFVATAPDSDDLIGCPLQKTSEEEADLVNVPSFSPMLQIYP